jgi:hypothetical protein
MSAWLSGYSDWLEINRHTLNTYRDHFSITPAYMKLLSFPPCLISLHWSAADSTECFHHQTLSKWNLEKFETVKHLIVLRQTVQSPRVTSYRIAFLAVSSFDVRHCEQYRICECPAVHVVEDESQSSRVCDYETANGQECNAIWSHSGTLHCLPEYLYCSQCLTYVCISHDNVRYPTRTLPSPGMPDSTVVV